MFDLAEFYIQEGEAKGLTRGLTRGRAEGLSRGLTKGRKEGILETAQKMIAKHLDSALVAECTGLSLEQVQSLASGV